jgi:hypothetical protein
MAQRKNKWMDLPPVKKGDKKGLIFTLILALILLPIGWIAGMLGIVLTDHRTSSPNNIVALIWLIIVSLWCLWLMIKAILQYKGKL